MTLANILTILRLIMIPFFVMAVIYGHADGAFYIFIVAGITDGLDGFIARFFNQKSVLGAFLDPMADKLLITSAFIVMAIPEPGIPYPIPVWLPILIISRDVLIVLLAAVLNMTFNVKHFPPSWAGKTTTFFQIAFIVGVLLQNAWGFPLIVIWILTICVTFFTVYSGLHYIWRMKDQVQNGSDD